MPYDVSKMTGKWKLGGMSDNFPAIMEKMGVTKEEFEGFKTAEYNMDMSMEGDTMVAKFTIFGKTIENRRKLGVEGEDVDLNGKKRRVTFSMEGDTLVSVHPDYDGKGLQVRTVRTLPDDNTFHETFKAGDLEGWVTAKRC